MTPARWPQPGHLFASSRDTPANHQLTDATDELMLRAVLARRATPLEPPAGVAPGARVGIGFDAHRLEAGRPMRLGGIAFPDEPAGLAGHSDGDVATHAVI